MKLGAAGIKTLSDLADLASDELVEILGEETMSHRLAGRVIMKAREIAFGITVAENEEENRENKKTKGKIWRH